MLLTRVMDRQSFRDQKVMIWQIQLASYNPHLQMYPNVHIEYECSVADILTPEQLKNSSWQPSDLPRPQQSTTEGQHSRHLETASGLSTSERGNPQPAGAAAGSEWPVYVRLSNGRVYGCDLVVSATGVVSNTAWIKKVTKDDTKLHWSEDGGIVVDVGMRSSVPGVYAAGDVCAVEWAGHSRTWFQVSGWDTVRA